MESLSEPYSGGNRTQSFSNTRYKYVHHEGYQQGNASTQRRMSGQADVSASMDTWYDANGFVSNTTQSEPGYNRAFVNDAQGRAIYTNQGAANGTGAARIENSAGGYLGGWIGSATQVDSLAPAPRSYIGNRPQLVNAGLVQRQLMANGEVMARYGNRWSRIRSCERPTSRPRPSVGPSKWDS